MITPEQQADWAANLSSCLADTRTSNCYIVAWLQANLGFLNDSLNSSFEISGGNIVPDMSPLQSGIYNEMYICHWTRKKALTVLGEMEYDWIEMEGKDQGRIKRVSHKEKSAAYQALAKDCEARLTKIVKDYRGGTVIPQQLTFNNRQSTPHNIYCAHQYFSPVNPVYQYFDSCQ